MRMRQLKTRTPQPRGEHNKQRGLNCSSLIDGLSQFSSYLDADVHGVMTKSPAPILATVCKAQTLYDHSISI